eukprot:gene19254-21182_t
MAYFASTRVLRRKAFVLTLAFLILVEMYLLMKNEDVAEDMEKRDDHELFLSFSHSETPSPSKSEDIGFERIVTSSDKKKSSSKSCNPVNSRFFPACEEKFKTMKSIWQSKCYKDVHKLDGTDCSLLAYLQEVEPFCSKNIESAARISRPEHQQELRNDLQGLLSLLEHKDYRKMKERIVGLWPDWVDAKETLKTENSIKLGKRKKILVYLGAFSFQRWLMLEQGIMGELVQWTDLITSLHILGHDVKVILDGKNITKHLPPDENGCASVKFNDSQIFDLIFTDILGVFDIRIQLIGSSNSARLQCKLRVLDSFGTEAEFNYDRYDKKIPGGKSGWGNLNLLLPQFMTYFPHSPDNTFLGFAAGRSKKNLNEPLKKENIAVIYGKHAAYLEGNLKYLDVIKDYFEIHATMLGRRQEIPSYVTNHGVLKIGNLTDLLARAKLFIGLGFPFEGPGPLDAISQGAVYLNPKFPVPKNKINDKFFEGKPFLRKLTSQNPYMEDFVQQPYAYTLDFRDKEQLVSLLKKIKDQKTFHSHLPREFTNVGLLEKVHILVQNQIYSFMFLSFDGCNLIILSNLVRCDMLFSMKRRWCSG